MLAGKNTHTHAHRLTVTQPVGLSRSSSQHERARQLSITTSNTRAQRLVDDGSCVHDDTSTQKERRSADDDDVDILVSGYWDWGGRRHTADSLCQLTWAFRKAAADNGGAENAAPENAGLEFDELSMRIWVGKIKLKESNYYTVLSFITFTVDNEISRTITLKYTLQLTLYNLH